MWEVLAGFSDGTPYLLESKSDRVIVAASGLSLTDNDLPFRALFVPLMHRLLSYLSQQQLRHDLLVGDTITARVHGIGLVPVQTPGSEYSVTPEQQAEARTVRFAATGEPGIYTIGEQQYAVNVLSEEGNLTRIPEPELAKKNLRLFKDARGRTSDLTNAFLLIAGLCLALEMLLLGSVMVGALVNTGTVLVGSLAGWPCGGQFVRAEPRASRHFSMS